MDEGEYKDPLQKKNVIISLSEHNKVDLALNLRYDGLRVSQFFNHCIQYYLKKEPEMMAVIDKIKGIDEDSGISVNKRIFLHDAIRERKITKRLESHFALDEDEIENIFDIIEEEE